MDAVLFPGQYIGELHTVTHQVPKLVDVGRWYKAGLDHAAHIQVADSLGVLAVGFVALLRLCVFGVGQSDTTGLFKDIEYGNPAFLRGFHVDAQAIVFGKPIMHPLVNEEKRDCLYSVRPLESVIPIQANIQVL